MAEAVPLGKAATAAIGSDRIMFLVFEHDLFGKPVSAFPGHTSRRKASGLGGRTPLSFIIGVAEFPLARRGKAIMFTAKRAIFQECKKFRASSR
ncbi:MAG TPA: hypothetical protein VHC00_11815 [Rhizobiaceae bacterium]|nr:hypothetical protein [Rhizobiaceae bacterium]